MKKIILRLNRETVVMVLSCIIIIGACFGYIAYKAMEERYNNNLFAESIENWFITDAKNQFTLLTSYECDQNYINCAKLRLMLNENFNSFSIVDKYDYITQISDDFKHKRLQFLVDSKQVEKGVSVWDDVSDPAIVLISSKGEYEYDEKFKDFDGKEYTSNDINNLRNNDELISESNVANESRIAPPKNELYNEEDYNYEGEYKPVDQMTQQEKREELIEMLERAMSQ
ncbi:hypothetical protein J7E78_16635 [Paenibacillus polymyxa]|uniref:hypothetical protein n=1 Tax=Paenibacillus polymyxa TaxID=1406 RepID=UPI001BE96188|nr:hypothetical protein [Paenibacillus polymyxa]MBT2285170.1 hypothetical protein [Paenibacillus polymyxa]